MSILINQVINRINKKNKNWMAIVCGETGSGKSYTALKIASVIDKSFNIDRVVFTVKDFMSLVTNKEVKKGMVIVFDEAGVEIASREWYSLRNKAINYVLQTFRHQNLAVIFTTPSFSFIDKQTRKLFHSYIEILSINRKKNYANTKWQHIQNNPKLDKTYYKFQRVKGVGLHKITNVQIHKPDSELIRQYEAKRSEYTKKLKKEIFEDIKAIEEKKRVKPKDLEIISDKVFNDYKNYINVHQKRKYIDQHLIRGKYKLSVRDSKIIKSKVEKQLKDAQVI